MWKHTRDAAIAALAAASLIVSGGPALADDPPPQGILDCYPEASAYVTAPGSATVATYAFSEANIACLLFPVNVVVTDSTSGVTLYSGSMRAGASYNADFTVARGDTVTVNVQHHFSTAEASATVLPVAPTPVSSLVASAATQTTVTLDWSAPSSDGGSAITGYLVDWGTGTAPTTGTEMVVSGLLPATSYTFAVTAQNGAGSSLATTVTATTATKPTPPTPPGPGPAPAPNPEPAAITPVVVVTPGAGNVDGTTDTDASPATVRQTVPGTWPKRSVLISGVPLVLGRLTQLRTNAGQQAVMSVTYLSPSIQSASVTISGRGRVGTVRAVLKPGAKSGAVVLTVGASAVKAGAVGYESLQASRRFAVRPAPR
jgi:chitodextrinase